MKIGGGKDFCDQLFIHARIDCHTRSFRFVTGIYKFAMEFPQGLTLFTFTLCNTHTPQGKKIFANSCTDSFGAGIPSLLSQCICDHLRSLQTNQPVFVQPAFFDSF